MRWQGRIQRRRLGGLQLPLLTSTAAVAITRQPGQLGNGYRPSWEIWPRDLLLP